MRTSAGGFRTSTPSRRVLRSRFVDAKSRIGIAWQLHRNREYDEALAQYEWLWRNIPTRAPQLAPVRMSFLATHIGQLAEDHPATRRRFNELRAETLKLAEAASEVASPARLEWLVLSEVMGMSGEMLAWFDRQHEQLVEAPDEMLARFLQRLAPVLMRTGRWKSLGLLRRDPLGLLRRMKPRGAQADHSLCRKQAANLYRRLLAASRHDEALAVRREALASDDSDDLRDLLAAAETADCRDIN